MASFTKSSSSSSLGRSSNPNSRSSELSDPMRRSFTGNPFSKPTLVANPRAAFVPTTPANTPTDSHRRNSVGGREVAGSFFRDLDDKENGKDQFLKASKARSAATSKSAKNFMSPTISAASKVAMSPKKKVLVERNEPVPTSVPSTIEAKIPSVRKVTFAEPLHSSDLKSENGGEHKKFVTSSFDDGVPNEEIHFAASLSCEVLSGEVVFDMNSPFNSKNSKPSFETVANEPDCVILDPSFKLSSAPTPPPPPVSSIISTLAPLDADPLMHPPYDPKTNYLSPRPQFLLYKPKPRMDRELGESLMSWSFSDTEVAEDTHSEEDSQKLEDVSSDEVIEEAGISEPSPAKTSFAEETVEAREVPKPHFVKSKTIFALLLLFSAVAFISVSVTNSSVMDRTVFQDFYKIYELSDRSEFAKAKFDQFSELANAKFDVSARNFHVWYTKSLSSISELISNIRGVHNLGHLQYYNLTDLQESNVVDHVSIFGPGKTEIVEIEIPEVYPQVLNNEEIDTALESEDYELNFVQQDVGVTSAFASVPEPEEALEGGHPATVIVSDQSSQVAEVSEPNHSSEAVVVVDQQILDAKAADIRSEMFNIENVAANMAQECDAEVVDKYSDGGLSDQTGLRSDASEIHTAEAHDVNEMLAEDERVNSDKYSDVGVMDQPGLDDSYIAGIHTEAVGDIELIEAVGESASIDAIEDNEERLETTGFSPHMVLYLLCGGTILIAGSAFKWSRKGISRKTKVTSSVEKPMFAKAAAFYGNSLPTPSYLDKLPSLRNGPTEIEEPCPSEMSSTQENSSSSRQKGVKELNEVNSLDKKPKKRRESLASSSNYSISPSYGSFTTYDRIKIKNGHGEEETITPVRRSSRVRSKASS